MPTKKSKKSNKNPAKGAPAKKPQEKEPSELRETRARHAAPPPKDEESQSEEEEEEDHELTTKAKAKAKSHEEARVKATLDAEKPTKQQKSNEEESISAKAFQKSEKIGDYVDYLRASVSGDKNNQRKSTRNAVSDALMRNLNLGDTQNNETSKSKEVSKENPQKNEGSLAKRTSRESHVSSDVDEFEQETGNAKKKSKKTSELGSGEHFHEEMASAPTNGKERGKLEETGAMILESLNELKESFKEISSFLKKSITQSNLQREEMAKLDQSKFEYFKEHSDRMEKNSGMLIEQSQKTNMLIEQNHRMILEHTIPAKNQGKTETFGESQETLKSICKETAEMNLALAGVSKSMSEFLTKIPSVSKKEEKNEENNPSSKKTVRISEENSIIRETRERKEAEGASRNIPMKAAGVQNYEYSILFLPFVLKLADWSSFISVVKRN